MGGKLPGHGGTNRAVGRVYAGWGVSKAFYGEEGYRELGFDTLTDFKAGVWENSFMNMDPQNVLAMLCTGKHADISASPSYDRDFDKTLRSIKAPACVMPGSTDLFCPADDNEFEAKLMPNAVFKPIESIWGHFAGRGINSIDNQFIDDNL